MPDAAPSNAFDGKVAIVTGGSGGLGSAACRELVARGARVVIVDLKGAHELAEELGDKCLGLAADVSDEEQVEKVVSKTLEKDLVASITYFLMLVFLEDMKVSLRLQWIPC